MSIDKNDLRKYITKSFIKNKSISFTDDTSLFEEGIIDSLGVLQLINYIEEKYGFTALDEELIPQNLDSINRLDIYISSKLAK
jgi:acyl carrier protein